MVFIDLLSYGPELKVHGNRVYISGRAGRYIDIYDAGGGRTGSIDCDFPTLKISGNQKNDIWELYRQNKEDIWVRAKEIISVPEYFPRFRTFVIADDKIYVQTYEKKISGTGFYVFNPEGRMLKKIYIPLVYRNSVTPYPYAIHRGELITLVENLDTGDWELRHITKPVNGS
jgi:hypothetical protein